MQELKVLDTNYDLTQAHTPCRDCIFALIDADTQYDCAASMFERFENNNITKTIVYDDNNNEFYVINGIQCPSFRSNKWKEAVEQKAGRLLTTDEYVDLVAKQNIINFYMMMFFSKGKTVEDLKHSINQCMSNTYQHVKYVFVCYQKDYGLVINTVRDSKLTNWRVETILEECPFDRAIDIAQKKSTGYQFSGIYPVGADISFSLLNKISESVYNFKNLACVIDNQGTIVYNKIFNMLGGNFDKPFYEKLDMVIEQTKETHLIKNGSDL